jgi:PAS domain S-box-containing protein
MEEMMGALMKGPDSIYFKDLNGKFIAVSEAKAANSNTAVEEMIGKTDFDFLPREEAEKILEDDKRVMETGEPIKDKVRKLTRPDGSEKWVSDSKDPLRNKRGKIIGVFGISRDITKRIEIEQHMRNMLSIATHDIRSPLIHIGNIIKLLLRGRFTDINVALKDLYKRVLHLEKVTNDYLCKSSLLDINGGLPKKERIDLRQDIIDPILEEHSEEIEEKNLLIDNVLGAISGNEVIIEGHTEWLRIVYRNLLRNSIKWVPPGSKIAFGIEDHGEYYRLNVYDSGSGVPEDKRDKIFEKFESGGESTGIGLHICRKLIELHGGNMWYEHTSHGHPNFIFTIPKIPTNNNVTEE